MAVHQLYLTAIVRLIRHYIPEAAEAPDKRMYQIAAKIVYNDLYFRGNFDLALAAVFMALPFMAKAEPRIKTAEQVLAYVRICKGKSKFYRQAEALAFKTPDLIERLLENQDPGSITPAMLREKDLVERSGDRETPIRTMREAIDDLTGDLFKNA